MDRWSKAVTEGRVTHEAAVVAVEELNADAQRTFTSFAGWDPPASVQGLRQEIFDIAGVLTETLVEDRIAAHRDQWPALTESVRRR